MMNGGMSSNATTASSLGSLDYEAFPFEIHGRLLIVCGCFLNKKASHDLQRYALDRRDTCNS